LNFPDFIDDYEVIEQIGAGSSSVVYKVKDKNGDVFALKLFHLGLNLTGSLKKRFLSEARTLEKVSSARTARLFRVGETESSLYLLMELVEGKPLDQVIENGPLSGLQLLSTIGGLVEALADTHASGVTHRDLKPANIILGPNGLKVIDFGLSAVEDANASTRSIISGGTPAWLSPEQAIGREVGSSSDIFSLGLVIAFLATGKNPFGQGKPDALIYRIVNESPDLSDVPEGLAKLVESCLQKDPADRPSIAQIGAYVADIDGGGLGSDQTLVASRTMIASFGDAQKTAVSYSQKTSPRRRASKATKVGMAALALVALVAGLAFIPAQGDLEIRYLNESDLNKPIFDSSLLIGFEDRSTRQINLPVGKTAELSEFAGDWTAGEKVTLSIEHEIDQWSSETTTIEVPRFFSIFRAGQPYFVTLILSDNKIDFYGTWSEVDSELARTLDAVAFATRSNEATYERQKRQERTSCVADEKSSLSRLVGTSTEFYRVYFADKNAVMQAMPTTLTPFSYRSRLDGLADKMFDRQLGAINPETSGNASELSDSVILAARDISSAHFDLIELVEWVGDTMVNTPRGYGSYLYREKFQREFALWTNGETRLRRATTSVTKAINNQAEGVCYSQFPELD